MVGRAMLAHEGCSQGVARGDLARGPVRDHATVLHDVSVIGDFERALDHLLDQQDGNALGAQRENGGEHLVDKYWGEPERGFVQHQQFGFSHHSLCDGKHLLLSAR